jgi:glutaredoxin|tara:strand:+ start:151 stop:396 length:246 start_codon:yes stop_codon:yes gene_type:complete
MKSYKIYGKVTCGYCIRLVQAMIEHKESFFVQFLDSQPKLLNQKKKQYNHHTVPIVVLRENNKETLIGGCTETMKRIKKEK